MWGFVLVTILAVWVAAGVVASVAFVWEEFRRAEDINDDQ